MVEMDYARANADNALVYVDDVANGLACDCHCAVCGKTLVAYNNGKVQAHHFAHQGDDGGVDHPFAGMTRLHIMAQDILSKSFRFRYMLDLHKYVESRGLPINIHFTENEPGIANKMIVDMTYTDGILEYEQDTSLGKIRYDVYFPDVKLGLEVVVTHDIDSEKERRINVSGDWVIRFDLTNYIHDDELTYADLEKILHGVIFYVKSDEADENIYGCNKYVTYLEQCTQYLRGQLRTASRKYSFWQYDWGTYQISSEYKALYEDHEIHDNQYMLSLPVRKILAKTMGDDFVLKYYRHVREPIRLKRDKCIMKMIADNSFWFNPFIINETYQENIEEKLNSIKIFDKF